MAKAARGKKVKVQRVPRKPRTPKSQIAGTQADNDLRRSLFYSMYDRDRDLDTVLKDVTTAYNYLTGNGEKVLTDPDPAPSVIHHEPSSPQPEPTPEDVPQSPRKHFESDRILM
jgi:hypothetical protein